MKKILQSILISFSLILISLTSLAGTESASVPLSVIKVAPQSYKVGIHVSVAGGPPTLVTFDTGGTGLHIFASQVGNTNITYTNEHIKSAFLSGLVYEGVIAYAPVAFGKVVSNLVPILVIQKAYCQASKPNCGAGNNPSNPTPVMGHFYGELGAGMIPEQHNNDPQKTLYTPFRALPGNYGTGFIIENLSPGQRGRLVLGLNPSNTAGFSNVQLNKLGTYSDGSNYYNDKALMVQYNINGIADILRTAFDTGGGPVVTFFTGNREGFSKRGRLIAPNQSFSASLPGGFNWQFTTGRQAGFNKVKTAPVVPAKGPFVNTGISFYFQYDVIYDFKDGVMGFKPH